MWSTVIGVAAAVLTTLSYLPQIQKCIQTKKAADLSVGMFAVLASGIACWVAYGFLKNDAVLIVANVLSLCCLAILLSFKFWPSILKGAHKADR